VVDLDNFYYLFTIFTIYLQFLLIIWTICTQNCAMSETALKVQVLENASTDHWPLLALMYNENIVGHNRVHFSKSWDSPLRITQTIWQNFNHVISMWFFILTQNLINNNYNAELRQLITTQWWITIWTICTQNCAMSANGAESASTGKYKNRSTKRQNV